MTIIKTENHEIKGLNPRSEYFFSNKFQSYYRGNEKKSHKTLERKYVGGLIHNYLSQRNGVIKRQTRLLLYN